MSKGVMIDKAWQEVERHNLGAAIAIARQMPEIGLLASAVDRLDRIEEDYGRMLSYMLSWYDDPQRASLYEALLYRLWQLLADVDLAYKKKNVRSYIDAVSMTRNNNMSYDFIRSVLEKYVTDLTMMSLNFGDMNVAVAPAGDTDKQELLSRHHVFMSRLFHSIWTSCQWNDSDKDFYSDLLASPSVDTNDATTLTGAVLLGLLENFDINKIRTLVAVYRNSSSEDVRQAALVGIMLGLPQRRFPFDLLDEFFAGLVDEEHFTDEVCSLQIQILDCMNAENDRQIIEKDILPTLVKNSKMSFGTLGLLDDEQSSVEEILHPEKQEQMMEEMEEKAMRMMKMQQDGADIYFGGFAHAKHVPFFNEMINWWMPFTMDHPSIPSDVREAVRKNRFLGMIINKGPFCHSDKYSLLVMGGHVAGKLPKEMETLQKGDEAFMEAELHVGKSDESAATVRRHYLQNLYRFYKLYTYRTDFRNPFMGLFLLDDMFRGSQWNKAKARVGHKLMRQKRWQLLARLMESCDAKDGETWYMLGSALIHGSDRYDEALEALRQALEQMPGNDKIMRLHARALFLTGDFAGAEQTYMHLYNSNEDRPTYCLNACVAMMKQEKYAEALKFLYKLDYKYDGNADIKKHIAWAQLMVGKTEKALELYRNMTENGSSDNPECFLGLGYCHWFMHDIKSAINSFSYYCKTTEASIDELAIKLLEDIPLLSRHDIDSCEVYMMVDMCRRYPSW